MCLRILQLPMELQGRLEIEKLIRNQCLGQQAARDIFNLIWSMCSRFMFVQRLVGLEKRVMLVTATSKDFNQICSNVLRIF